MSIVDVYDRLAAERGGDVALIIDRPPHASRLTWGELVQQSHTVAQTLRTCGVGEGSRCAVAMVDHPDLLPTVLAVWRCGGVVVPVDRQWGDGTRHAVLAHSGVDLLVDVARRNRVRHTIARPERPELPADTSMISYTSGSTSDPKGVVLAHQHICHAYEAGSHALVDLLGQRPRRFGVSMRMSGLGILGMNYLWPAVLGATVVVLPELGLVSAPSYWSALRAREVDVTYLVPPLVELLNRTAHDADGDDTVTCLSGGAPLSVAAQDRFQTRFRAILLNIYGLTEVSFAAFFGHREPLGKATPSIGAPATVEARLRDRDGNIVIGAGEGELELAGAAVSYGYYDNAKANAELFQAGWLRTGDLASRDAAGRYRIVGRKKDVATKGAFSIYLHEIEEVANSLPGVLESAAVRLELPAGEDIGLIVRHHHDGDVETDEIQYELESRLGRQRAPRRIVVTAQAIPRIGQSKIDRRAALALWSVLTRT